jgi:hypothetical protein
MRYYGSNERRGAFLCWSTDDHPLGALYRRLTPAGAGARRHDVNSAYRIACAAITSATQAVSFFA